jgi:hypothetical protein
MTTYDLTKNAKITYKTVSRDDISILNRIQGLENKVASQSEKLDQIIATLNELSKKKSTS